MKARLENGKVVKYSRLPKEYEKYVAGFDTADSSIHEAAGFFDIVVPTYDSVTQVIHNLHFDNSYPAPTPDDANATREVFTYDVKSKTISETVAQLKTQRIDELKKLAYDKLQPTDWMAIRKAEKGTAIPSATQTERDSIRTTVTTKEAEINALTTKAAILKYDISF
jgi:hypothetical protein